MKPYLPCEPWVHPRTKRRFACEDCGNAPDAPMIVPDVWHKIGDGKTLLCCGCLEKRLGRPIKSDDLVYCPMNGAALWILARYEPRRSLNFYKPGRNPYPPRKRWELARRLRDQKAKIIPTQTWREIAKSIGIGENTLYCLVHGGAGSPETCQKVERWLEIKDG